MRAAGVARYSAEVELLDLPEPGRLAADEVLLEVRCCGVGNWDEIARNGGWDLGRQPPMALGVEAAGIVAGTGSAVTGLAVGDRVMTHSLPLRAQGAWAERFVAAAADVAAVPEPVPFDVAAALPVPALTAAQALGDGPGDGPGVTVLVNGASGVTGMLLVQLARHLGARVIATAGPRAPPGSPPPGPGAYSTAGHLTVARSGPRAYRGPRRRPGRQRRPRRRGARARGSQGRRPPRDDHL